MFYHSHILTWFPCFLNYSQPQYSYFEAKSIHSKICKKMFSSISFENAVEKWHERKKKFTKPHNYLRRDAEFLLPFFVISHGCTFFVTVYFLPQKIGKTLHLYGQNNLGRSKKRRWQQTDITRFRTTNPRNLSKQKQLSRMLR